MRKLLRYINIAIMTVLVSSSVALPASAVDLFQGCTADVTSAVCTQKSEGTKDKGASMIQYVVNTILYLLGIIAVIVIIVGGFTYATSGGDTGKIAQGKNTILYAVIGLIVGIFSFAIVNLVIFRVQGTTSSQTTNKAASNNTGGTTP